MSNKCDSCKTDVKGSSIDVWLSTTVYDDADETDKVGLETEISPDYIIVCRDCEQKFRAAWNTFVQQITDKE